MKEKKLMMSTFEKDYERIFGENILEFDESLIEELYRK
jgi:hypothetical protein